MPEHGHEWMSLRRVAELMGVSERTVYRWTTDGLPVVLRGRQRWTRRDWLDEFLVGRDTLTVGHRWRWAVTALLVTVAVTGGMLVEMLFRLELHPVGVDVDALLAILVGIGLALTGDRVRRRQVHRFGRPARAPGRARGRPSERVDNRAMVGVRW